MKAIKGGLFLVMLISTLNYVEAAPVAPNPLLVVVLMVKDEEPVVCKTLQPYIDAGLKHYLILDTGSTDKTIEVTDQLFKQHGIKHYFIEQEPFVDFSTSRNRSLDLAEQRFPQAEYMLMVDAEWYMHNVEGLVEYCKQEMGNFINCYYIRLLTCFDNSPLDYYLPRLMRCRKNVRYIGVVHETPDVKMVGKLPEDIWFNVQISSEGFKKSERRWIRDRDMLLKFLEKHPDSPRDTFYLAQTFGCLGDWDNAYAYYEKRTRMPGWEEENYMAWYRIGEVAELLASERDHDEWWPKALAHYMKAYTMRPWRIEPLIRIAHHYLARNEKASAYLFSRRAAEIDYPQDILFVEKDFYHYVRYDLLSQCAHAVGAYDVGEWATRKAIEARPEAPHLYRNLAVYVESIRAMNAKKSEQQKQHLNGFVGAQ